MTKHEELRINVQIKHDRMLEALNNIEQKATRVEQLKQEIEQAQSDLRNAWKDLQKWQTYYADLYAQGFQDAPEA